MLLNMPVLKTLAKSIKKYLWMSPFLCKAASYSLGAPPKLNTSTCILDKVWDNSNFAEDWRNHSHKTMVSYDYGQTRSFTISVFIHFELMLYFCIPWKSMVFSCFRGYRNGAMFWNWLMADPQIEGKLSC